MLAKSSLMILMIEKAPHTCTIDMDGLNFLKSCWHFNSVNLKMTNCYAAFLTLDLKYVTNVFIENSIFGNWTFRQVQHIFVKNSSTSYVDGALISLNFYNSSVTMENINIKDVNVTRKFDPIITINKSCVQITKSNFVNNKVNYGIIQILDSSTLEMSDCVVQNNQDKTSVGAIYTENSIVYITNTNFYNNEAVSGSGACSMGFSTITLIQCSFYYNSDSAVLLITTPQPQL